VLLLVARIERSVAPLVSMRASEHISDPPIAHVGLPRAVDPVRGDPPCGWRERAPRARIRGGGRKTRTQVGGRTQPRRSLGQQRDAIFSASSLPSKSLMPSTSMPKSSVWRIQPRSGPRSSDLSSPTRGAVPLRTSRRQFVRRYSAPTPSSRAVP